MSQLFDDCLNEIFEYLGDDITSLHSCLLVNRLWCKVSVRILWRNSWNYSDSTFDTLIACLPSKSKEILYKNKIIILTPISKPPMFNYTAFCKVLSIEYVHYTFLLRPKLLTSCNNVCILSEELFKMFMEQITSLKELYFFDFSNITLTSYSGAKDCLRNLSELHCSNVFPDFFYQLSKICHNISSLNIIFKETKMNGLTV
ncbi:unnamed protein product [Rhizophagus irregularis]|nr:unnamed protein product [Rhizophagus irregularis]